jgi:hypothetical protein
MSVDDAWWLASLRNPVSATRNPSFAAAFDTFLGVNPTDEALAGLGGAAGVRPRRATT